MFSGMSEENAWRRRSRGVGTRGASGSSLGGVLRAGWGRVRLVLGSAAGGGADLERSSGGADSASSAASVLRNRAASGPSRMLARLAFATVENLLGELPVGLSCHPVRLVLEHWHPLHRRLRGADSPSGASGRPPV